jgi:hypothetical protein
VTSALGLCGGRPGGPSPLPSGNGAAIEVERIVNGVGLIGLARRQRAWEIHGTRPTRARGPQRQDSRLGPRRERMNQ